MRSAESVKQSKSRADVTECDASCQNCPRGRQKNENRATELERDGETPSEAMGSRMSHWTVSRSLLSEIPSVTQGNWSEEKEVFGG